MSKIINIAQKNNIVILGAGFAGVLSALKLSKLLKEKNLHKLYSVILINESPHHLFTPALYEIASIPKNKAVASALFNAVLIPIEDIVRGHGIIFIEGKIAQINRFKKALYFDKGDVLDYEYCILCPGAESNFYAIVGLEEHSYPFKTFRDALILRNKIDDLVSKKAKAKIVVVGGGAAGIELVAEFHNYLYSIIKTAGPYARTASLELIEASPNILAGFPRWFVSETEVRLKRLAVTIKTRTRVLEVRDAALTLEGGGYVPYDLLIWAGGVRAASVLKTARIPLEKKGEAIVNEFLQSTEDASLFVIGDSAYFTNQDTGKPLPWSVPIAETEARHAAKNIIRLIQKKPLLPYLPQKKFPFILAVGGKYAIADLVVFHFAGFFAWFLKQIVELRYLVTILPIQKALFLWLKSVRLFNSND